MYFVIFAKMRSQPISSSQEEQMSQEVVRILRLSYLGGWAAYQDSALR